MSIGQIAIQIAEHCGWLTIVNQNVVEEYFHSIQKNQDTWQQRAIELQGEFEAYRADVEARISTLEIELQNARERAALAEGREEASTTRRLMDEKTWKIPVTTDALPWKGVDEPLGARADSNIVQKHSAAWRGRARRWKIATAITSGVAAGLLVLVTTLLLREEKRFVAVMEGEAGGSAVLATTDVNRNQIFFRNVAAQPLPSDATYQVFLIGGGRGAPESLGILGSNFTASTIEANLHDRDIREIAETRVAMSREPRGGSPTGQPTGEVVYIGKFISVK